MLAVVVAIELSRRGQPDDRWAPAAWSALSPLLWHAERACPGPAGTAVVAVPLARPDDVRRVASEALKLPPAVAGSLGSAFELRGGIALGVIDGHRRRGVERCAERLALAAAPGQWLVVEEVARLLESTFELRGVGVVPRWRMPLVPVNCRALVGAIAPATLPSAVAGDPPAVVLGRGSERRRLLAELAAAAGGRRRVLLVTAPAGGGKSHLLRRVLADADLEVPAGVAFPPLGAATLEPIRALLGALGAGVDADAAEKLGGRLGTALSARARAGAAAVVVDDVHWAEPQSLHALRTAIGASDENVPLAWILSARTASLPRLGALSRLADAHIALPPLRRGDRIALLERQLGSLPRDLCAHVASGPERGNPLYLEHLAAALEEADSPRPLPANLHEAVLARLDRLVERARALTNWTQRSASPQSELEALENEVGDWLDRLETTDLAELATIGRYLGRLRRADAELVIARSLLGMPVAANRRVMHAIERLAAASTQALLDHLTTVARGGHARQAAHEAIEMARRAELAVRLADAERLLSFACEHNRDDPVPLRKRADIALALGRCDEAIASYVAVAQRRGRSAELERRVARAQAAAGRVPQAIHRLDDALRGCRADQGVTRALELDRARLRGVGPAPPNDARSSPAESRRAARVTAWADPVNEQAVHEALGALVLDGAPAACAAELVEIAALARLGGVHVGGLVAAAGRAAELLGNPSARHLLQTADVDVARCAFLHWEA